MPKLLVWVFLLCQSTLCVAALSRSLQLASSNELLEVIDGDAPQKPKMIDFVYETQGSSTVYHRLSRELYEDVGKPLSRFSHFLTTGISNDALRSLCENVYPIEEMSRALLRMVKRCGDPELDMEILEEMYEFINSFEFLNCNENTDFRNKFSIVYFQLENKGLQFTQQFFRRFNNLDYKMVNKHVLINKLLQGLIDEDWVDGTHVQSNCLPKAAFVVGGFTQLSIYKISGSLRNSYDKMIHMAQRCAEVTFNNRTAVDKYILKFKKDVEPVADFLDMWLPNLMRSTFPSIEKNLMKNFVNSIFCQDRLEEANSSYSYLAKDLEEHMHGIGHPRLTKKFVVTTDYRADRSSRFFYDCSITSCISFSARGLTVVAIRVDPHSSHWERKLANYFDEISPTVKRAFYWRFAQYDEPEKAIRELSKSHGLDLLQFGKHRAIVVLHTKTYFDLKPNNFGISSRLDPSKGFVKHLSFIHEERWNNHFYSILIFC